MSMAKLKTKKSSVPQRTKLKKDPGIPRLPDIKIRQSYKERASTLNAHRPTGHDPDSVMASEPTLSTLALLASQSDATVDDPSSSSIPDISRTKEQMRKYYLKTLHKVIDQSDIIVLVLDARDPEGCRSRLVEEEVRRRESEGKKLIFVLNKIDLIPRANAQLWLKHLRHSTPTLPFLSSSSAQHQKNNISSATAPSLLKLIKAYKPKAGSVTVGVVGYPNVGKSTLINSLKRSKVCAVAAQPGHTKDLQSVQLERGMRIIDSPGVVFDEDDEELGGKTSKKGSILLRNVVKVEDVEDPIAVVEEILSRTASTTIQKIYNMPEFSSTLEFLTMFALTNGRLLKGGTPDLNSAARQILSDWNHQKIPYFSLPPEIHPSLIPSTVPSNSNGGGVQIAPGAENVGQAQILSSLSEPFKLEGLFGAADAGAFGTATGDVNMNVDADEDGDMFWDASEGNAMDEDEEARQMEAENISPRSLKRPRSPSPVGSLTTALLTDNQQQQHQRRPKRFRKSKEVPAYDAPVEEHVLRRMAGSNPMSRQALKKEAKKARKAGRVRGAGASIQGAGMDIDDDGLAFTFMA